MAGATKPRLEQVGAQSDCVVRHSADASCPPPRAQVHAVPARRPAPGARPQDASASCPRKSITLLCVTSTAFQAHFTYNAHASARMSPHEHALALPSVALTSVPQPFPRPEDLFILRPLCEKLVLSLSSDISRFESYVFYLRICCCDVFVTRHHV
jgi:hypothetical protein